MASTRRPEKPLLHAAAALLLGATLARAAPDPLAPFLPTEQNAPARVRVLAPVDAVQPGIAEAFSHDTGVEVAVDAYSHGQPAEFAGRRYDLVILRGPALAEEIAAGALARLDRGRAPNARKIQPAVTAKLAAYDRDGVFGLAFGWSAFGLIYDFDKVRDRLGGPPTSFAQALDPRDRRRLADCGVVWPDSREESFVAAWKMESVEPARARLVDVKSAGQLLEKAKTGMTGFAAPDTLGLMAKGAACLGAGTEGEAAAARARAGDNGPALRFAYPREGAPVSLYAYAIPRDAPTPETAYRLLDRLLEPDNAARDAASAGLANAQSTEGLEELRRLAPEPAFDLGVASAVRTEWRRVMESK